MPRPARRGLNIVGLVCGLSSGVSRVPPHPWVVLADSKGLKSPVLPGRDKGLPTGGRRPSSLLPKPLFLYAVEIKQPKGFLMQPSPNHPPPLPGRSASCQDTRTPAGRGGTSCFLCSVALFPARPRICCNVGDRSFAGGFLTIVPPIGFSHVDV